MAKTPVSSDIFADFEFVQELPKSLRNPNVQGDPVANRRNKLLAAIESNREYWNNPEKLAESGEGKKRARVWFKREGTTVYMSPRYGARPLELVPGAPIVKLQFEDVGKFLDAIAKACETGKLDEKLAILAERTTEVLKGARKAA